jgi:hypothetical protein
VLFVRVGAYRQQHFSTSIVDVEAGQLLDVVPGRSGRGPTEWLEARGKEWRRPVRCATLDLSGPYRAVFDAMLLEQNPSLCKVQRCTWAASPNAFLIPAARAFARR